MSNRTFCTVRKKFHKAALRNDVLQNELTELLRQMLLSATTIAETIEVWRLDTPRHDLLPTDEFFDYVADLPKTIDEFWELVKLQDSYLNDDDYETEVFRNFSKKIADESSAEVIIKKLRDEWPTDTTEEFMHFNALLSIIVSRKIEVA
ncbi:MAG: hypothetical protein PHT88_00660 [Candidatus Moranbacteria bacterium]|nr:hypothetical protein [Candidatus Moranbacteria bacterium]